MRLTVRDSLIEDDGPRLVLDTLDASEAIVGRLVWQMIESAASRHVEKHQQPFVLKNETMEIRLDP